MSQEARLIRLGEVAHTRSGDKGDRSNIGVVARDAATYEWLEAHLTEQAVAEFFRPMGVGKVTRYELPSLCAFNFIIDRALAGGASRSLRIDTQGKALGTVLLELLIPAPPSWRGSLGFSRGLPSMSSNLVLREDRGPVTILTLNRPDQRNALSLLARRQSARLSRASQCRCSGCGSSYSPAPARSFCTGMDLKEAATASDAPESEGNDDRDPRAVRRRVAVPAHALEADDCRRQWRRAGRWCRIDGRLRPGRRRGARSDRLSGGQAWSRAVDRASRSLSPDRRPSRSPVGALRRADLAPGCNELGDGQSGDVRRKLSRRGGPARERACSLGATVRSRPRSGCSTNQPDRPQRSSRRSGRERSRTGIGRGTRGDSGLHREATAGLGSLQAGSSS